LRNILYIGSFALFFLVTVGILNFVHVDNNLAQNNVNENSIQTIDPHKDIKILSSQMIKEDGNWIISGKVQNTGNYKMRYVSITVNFYGKNGNLLYSTFAGESYITPGEIWNFEVRYRKSVAPYSYKIEVGPIMYN
jgi:hypothetical protein